MRSFRGMLQTATVGTGGGAELTRRRGKPESGTEPVRGWRGTVGRLHYRKNLLLILTGRGRSRTTVKKKLMVFLGESRGPLLEEVAYRHHKENLSWGR